MSELLHYSPEDVIVLLSGVSIAGMAEGTFISVSKEDAPFTTKVTADGVVSRSYTKSPVYTVNITLHSASPSNDVLTDFWLSDELSRRGFFSVLIKDPLGTSVFDASVGWISKTPVMEFGEKITNREWTISCVESNVHFGGNGEPSSDQAFTNALVGVNQTLNRVGGAFNAINQIGGTITKFEDVLSTPVGRIAVKVGNLL